MLNVYALLVSIILAGLSWRRVGSVAAGVTTMALAVGLAIVQFVVLEPADPLRQIIRASFIVVPSAMLVGASRVRWLERHVWVLVLLGPVVFGGCFAGICGVCEHLQLI
jgi:hypothetical protein